MTHYLLPVTLVYILIKVLNSLFPSHVLVVTVLHVDTM